MSDWFHAFLLTLAVEVPIWLLAGRLLSWRRRVLVALGTSSVTHPILWFGLPWGEWPYLPMLVGGEISVIAIEALIARALGLGHPLKWAMLANAASVAVGFLMRWWIGWP